MFDRGPRRQIRPGPVVGAFTLIELLVVIAIVAILASLLLPSISKAKDSSKRINRAGRLRQIAIASLLYVDEHQDRFPGQVGDGLAIQAAGGDGNNYYDLLPMIGVSGFVPRPKKEPVAPWATT